MKKTFCIDTNVLLYDPMAIFAFEDNDVVVPLIVLEEIDSLKTRRFDDAGKNARTAIRILDDLRKSGNLAEGVPLPGGGKLRVTTSENSSSIPTELSDDKVDNFIISTALSLIKSENIPVRLITKDISMRIKCDILNVPCDDYLKHRVAGKTNLIYGGMRVLEVTREQLDAFFAEGFLNVADLQVSTPFLPNEYVVIKNHHASSGLGRFVSGTLKRIIQPNDIWGLRPRNKEQKFALDALLDNNIKLTTLIGSSGTGKTSLALAAGLQQVIEERKFDKLLVTRPIQPLGRDLGYLPGTKEEKMEPWIQPIMDNLQFLFSGFKNGKDTIKMYFETGVIEVEAITYIRGRSIPRAYIIIDEAQNLTVHELKTLITRAGEGTKIVLTGDVEQIDNDNIDAVSNGLAYAVEKFKSFEISGHMTLLKGERSQLATLASEIL